MKEVNKEENIINLVKSKSNIILDGFKVVDIDGDYFTIENLKLSHFRNGDEIFEANTNSEWHYCSINNIPAWCYFENDSENGKTIGKLYNAYCLIDKREIAPKGWELISKIDTHKYIKSINVSQIKSGMRNFEGAFRLGGYVSCYFWMFDFCSSSYFEYLKEIISNHEFNAHKTCAYNISVKQIEPPVKMSGIDLRMGIGNKNNFDLGDGYSIRLKRQ
jgi:hypothetical protein